MGVSLVIDPSNFAMATPSQLPTPKSTDLAIDPSWQKGDFEIVTSDKVVLCVNSLSLRCWS